MIDPSQWLEMIQQLSQPERRLEICATLAAHLGAEELLLLVEDAEVEAYLPARGLKQRLPRSPSWKSFLARLVEEGELLGEISQPGATPTVAAWGRRLGGSLLLVVLGGRPPKAFVDECATYLALLQSALALERNEIATKRQLAAARMKAEQSANLARELDGTRWALQEALTQAQEANARASLLLEAGEMFTTSLEVEPILKSLCQIALEQLCCACVAELWEPGTTQERAAADGEDSLVDEAYLSAPERELHLRSADAWLWSRGQVRVEEDPAMAQHLALLKQRGVISALFVPLRARNAKLGHLTLLRASGRSYQPEDLRLAEELARRAALSLDNARLYHEAQRAIRTRDEFLSVASHELRTPLTGLKLHLATLQRALDGFDGPQSKPELLRRFEVLTKQSSRLGKLVEQLLDVTRISAGKLGLELEPVELSALVGDVVARLQEAARLSGVELTLDAHAPVRGLWDYSRLEQVVTNLVTNAIKYGGGRPVCVRVEESDWNAVICVRDHGIGIAPENFARIFNQFERAVAAGNYEGLGLGLYISRQLVSAHGGDISVSSAPGEGSSFIVQLPFHPVVEQGGPPREKRAVRGQGRALSPGNVRSGT